jgi:hypothetical protein
MVHPRIVNNFSLWDFLLGKLKLGSGVSSKEKLQFLSQEVNHLLEEVDQLWNGCCNLISEFNQVKFNKNKTN